MKLYKITTQDNLTRKGYSNETLWGENVTHSKRKKDYEDASLCTSDVIHAYLSPELAVLLNPIHANIDNPKLWIAEGDVVVAEGQLKVGTFELTTIKEIPLPEFTIEQKVAFGILCAKEVYNDKRWNDWADKWLSGEDRSEESADYAASYYARVAATYYAARAAYTAYYAARSAAAYAAYASSDNCNIDLNKIIEKVKKEF